MRTRTVIARMAEGDPHAFAEARRKLANVDVCEQNRDRLDAALVMFAHLEGTKAPETPATEPDVDPVILAAEAAASRLRALAGRVMASSQDKRGAEPWDDLLDTLPEPVADELEGILAARGKVTYQAACNVLGVDRRKDVVPA